MKKFTLIILTILAIALCCSCGGNVTNIQPSDVTPFENTATYENIDTGALFLYNADVLTPSLKAEKWTKYDGPTQGQHLSAKKLEKDGKVVAYVMYTEKPELVTSVYFLGDGTPVISEHEPGGGGSGGGGSGGGGSGGGGSGGSL